MPSSDAPAPAAAPTPTQHGSRLWVAFGFLIAATTALIVLGALVRAHDAGLACPDWPQCFGVWIPEMNLEIAFEWGHRVLAGSVATIYAGLALWLARFPAPRRRAGRWILLGAVFLLVQIVLGGLTVLLKLASWTVTAHLLMGNAFNATLLVTALSLRDEDSRSPPRLPGRGALLAFAALLVLQLALGGAVSSQYAGLACPEWPTCNGGSWFPSLRGGVGLHLAHRMNGYLLFGVSGFLCLRGRSWQRGQLVLMAPLALVTAQIGVGVANVRLALPVEITALHSALAALLVLVTTWLCYTQLRHATL